MVMVMVMGSAKAATIQYTFIFVDENRPNGSLIGFPGLAGALPPAFFPPTYTDLFNLYGTYQVHPVTGAVTVVNAGTMDAEFSSFDFIYIQYSDIFDGPSQTFYDVYLNDLNDNALSSISDVNGTTNQVNENSGAGVPVGITAFASDADVSSFVGYSLVSNPGGYFQINVGGNGVVSTSGTPLDYESTTSVTIRVRATEFAHGDVRERNFTINVLDLNDNALSAVGDANGTSNRVDENSVAGKTVGYTATASDDDGTANIDYQLVSNPGNHFQINSTSGIVTTSATPLDDESTDTVTIRVRATENTHGDVSENNVVIAVNDLNDNPLSVVTDSNAAANQVDENTPVGVTVGVTGLASDADRTSNIEYSLVSNPGSYFQINSSTGVVRTSGTSLDHETVQDVTVRIGAEETTSGDSNVEDFVINIGDLNDNVLSGLSDANAGANTIDEESPEDTVVALTALATDDDGTADIQYSLTSNPGGFFKIDPGTGVVAASAIEVDFESITQVTIEVTATETTSGDSTNRSFDIDILDVDEFALSAVSDSDGAANAVDENAGAGLTVGLDALATDLDATAVITYAITSNPGNHFQIDTNTGEVTTTANSIDHETTSSVTINIEASEAVSGDQTNADFVINVNDLNDNALSVVSDANATANGVAENAAVDTVVNLEGLATDPDGTANVTYALTSNPGNHFKIDAATGVVTTTATALDYENDTSITIRIEASENTHGDSASADFVIAVSDLNDVAPAFTSAATASITENTTAVVTVTTTETDTVGSAHTYTVTGGDDAGLFSVGAISGDLVFDAAPNFEAPGDTGINNVYEVEVTANDGANNTVQAISVTVTGVNDTPTVSAAADSTVDEDAASYNFDLRTNASDEDLGDSLTVINLAHTGGDDSGISVSGNELTITPSVYNALAVGESSINTYTFDVRDVAGTTVAQTATITVTGVNDGPSGAADSANPDEDAPVSVAAPGPLANDTDPDTSDILVVGAVEGAGGNVGSATTLASGAIVTMNADGSYSYDPSSQFENLAVGETDTDSFGYTVSDVNGGTDDVTVSITIDGVNDAPTANADTGPVDENDVLNVSASGLLSNDTDPDTSDTLVVSEVEGSAANVGNQITLGSGALLTLNADGSMTYDPNGQFESLAVGESQNDPFSYTISDGNGGTAVGTATPVVEGENDIPSGADTTLTVDEDGTLTFADGNFGFSDTDTSDTLVHVTLTTLPVLGDVKLSGVAVVGGQDITLADIPNLTYEPDPNDDGPGYATLEFLVFDGNADSAATNTITFDVTGVADAPALTADATPNGDEDTFIALTVASSLNDPTNESLVVVVDGVPTGATLSDGTNSSAASSVDVTAWNLATLGITPPLHDSDPFTLTLTATATEALSADTAQTVITSDVTVNGVADAPGVVTTPASGDEDTAIPVSITTTPVDTSEVLTYSLSNVLGTLSVGTDQGGNTWSLTQAQLLSGVAVTPVLHDSDDFIIGVVVTTDDGGDTDTVNDSINVTVNPRSDAPGLVVADAAGNEDTVISLSVTGTLVDPSETLTYELTGVVGALNQGTDNGGGSWSLTAAEVVGLTLTPPLDYDSSFSITVTANSDDFGEISPTVDTVVVTVNGVNDDPIIADTSFSIPENTSNGTSVGVHTGTDIEPGALTYSTTSSEFAVNATTGEITVANTAALDFETVTSIDLTMTVTDVDGGSNDATVTVNLTAVNDNVPVANTDTPSVNEGATVNFDVLTNDTDADAPGDTLTVTEVNGDTLLVGAAVPVEVSGTVVGDLTVNADGSATFVTTSDVTVEIFSASATYTMNDGGSSPQTGTIDITINPQNDNAPTLTAAGLALDGNTLLTYDEDSILVAGLPAGTEDLTSYFEDLDIDADGLMDGDTGDDNDALVFSLVGSTNAFLVNATVADRDLNVYSPDHEHGSATLTIQVVDTAGPSPHAPLSLEVDIIVNSVNDGPLYAGSYADQSVDEDSPDISVPLDASFHDFDLLDSDPSDDALTYTVTIEDQPNDYVLNGVIDESVLPGTVTIVDENDGIFPPPPPPDPPRGPNRTITVVTTDPSFALSLREDAHGTVDVTVVASDMGVPNLPPLPLTSTQNFSVTVNPIGDDTPTAVDDHYDDFPVLVMEEDSDGVVFNVTGNDDNGDAPSRVINVGEQYTDELGLIHRWRSTTREADPNNTGDTQEVINGEVTCRDEDGCLNTETGDTTVDGSGLDVRMIAYKPLLDFNGEDSFTYCINDSQSGGEAPMGDPATDQRCAEVTVHVTAVNDKPVPNTPVVFVMDQAETLAVDPTDGLRSQVVDVDNTHIDGQGCNPLEPTCSSGYDVLYFQLKQVVTAHGQLLPPFTNDGAFTYQPDPTFAGEDQFLFDVCDVPLPGTADNCEYDVVATITIEPVDSAPEASDDGPVLFDYNLAQIPLELPIGPEPNVLIVNDDSGSMKWDILTDQSSGLYYYSSGNYIYYTTKASAGTSTYVAPSEEAATNQGLWRLRSAEYNTVYYNPEIRYEPWEGLNTSDQEFPDSDPTAARHNPLVPTPTTNLTQEQTYTGRAVTTSAVTCSDVCLFYLFGFCWWEVTICSGGSGFQQVTVNDYYIPRYYRWTDRNSNGVLDSTPSPVEDPVNSEGALVEVRSPADGGPASYPKFDDRTDCTSLTNACSYDEELQNFANWFTYSRDREMTAKSALGKVISSSENIRIGYAVLNDDDDDLPIASMNTSDRTGNKADLLDQIYQTDSGGGTPLRRSLRDAGRHYECVANDIYESSGSSSPGDDECPILAGPDGNCQQNFTLLITDGAWNGSSPSVGNTDGDGNSSFDGNLYADSYSSTLADVAMHYYERDLHSTLTNEVPTTGRDTGGASDTAFEDGDNVIMHQHMSTYTVGFGVVGEITSVPVDYTQSFAWGNPTSTARKIDDLWHAAVNGRGEYLNANNAKDLSDALLAAFEEFAQGAGAASAVSFNSQEVQEDTLIFRAFYNTKTNTGDLIAQSFTESGLVDEPVWEATVELDSRTVQRQILTQGEPGGFKKGVPFVATSLTDAQKDLFISDPTESLTEAQKLQQVEERVDYLRGDRSLERPVGNFRERPTIGGSIGDIVHSAPVFLGPPNRDGMTGDAFPTTSYASYKSAFGGRERMVYVSSNDGLVHGFRASDGYEVFGYMPANLMTAVYSRKISELLNYQYEHRFFLDLTVAINDVFIRPNPNTPDKEWASILVGGHGAGAKAYFALNVSDPTLLNEANADEVVLWEFTDEDDHYPLAVPGDLTSGPKLNGGGLTYIDGLLVKDMGYTFSVPTLSLSNVEGGAGDGNEWVAIFGNGINNSAGSATLFILFISDGVDGDWCHPAKKYNTEPAGPDISCLNPLGRPDFVKITTNQGTLPGGVGNALGTPVVVDVDNNGTSDYAYAGDRGGNLYRFDLTDPNPANWSVHLIFEAVYEVGGVTTAQPITTKPTVVRHPVAPSEHIVIFATGSYVTVPDGSSEEIQSIYGIHDNLAGSATFVEKDDLQEQFYTNEGSESFGFLRTLSDNPVNYTVTPAKKGWFIDLDAPAVGGTHHVDPAEFPGERAIRNIQIRGGVAFVNSVIPRSDTSCVDIAGGFINAFCPTTGGSECFGSANGEDSGVVFDINNDGEFNEADLLSDDGDDPDDTDVDDTYDQRRGGAGQRLEDAVPTDSSFIGNKRITQLSDKSLNITETNTEEHPTTGTLSWKQLEELPPQ